MKATKLGEVSSYISAFFYAVTFPLSVVKGDGSYVPRISFYLPEVVRERLGLNMIKCIWRRKSKVFEN